MDKYAGWDRRNDRYCYDLLRQLTAHIKKTYIHKTTAGNAYHDYRSSPTHCLPVQILSPLAHTNISRRVTLCIKPNKIILFFITPYTAAHKYKKAKIHLKYDLKYKKPSIHT